MKRPDIAKKEPESFQRTLLAGTKSQRWFLSYVSLKRSLVYG